MNLTVTLSVFSTLVIGMMPAYQIAMADRPSVQTILKLRGRPSNASLNRPTIRTGGAEMMTRRAFVRSGLIATLATASSPLVITLGTGSDAVVGIVPKVG
jgi:hypothetical protein